jgi:hypothetical protein
LTKPIIFEPYKGSGYRGIAFGYKATLLPKVCWVYHDAIVAGKILPSQQRIAVVCEIMLRALTNVAIDALIDEATGFQDMRARDALQKFSKNTSPMKQSRGFLHSMMNFTNSSFRSTNGLTTLVQ